MGRPEEYGSRLPKDSISRHHPPADLTIFPNGEPPPTDIEQVIIEIARLVSVKPDGGNPVLPRRTTREKRGGY